MFRWLFLLLILANGLPALKAGNDRLLATGGLPGVTTLAASEQGNVRTLRLLSETGAEGESDENSPVAKALPQRRESLCFLIGPLASMSKAESYAEHLEASDVAFARRWREIAIGSDYWVYLPQLPSVRATTRTLLELKARDIDGFIFSEGEMKGAIALGVFTEREVAEERRGEFVAMGYEAELQKMDRLAREYWLMSDKLPRPGMMDELMNLEELGEIPQKISRRDCKTVASAMQFQ